MNEFPDGTTEFKSQRSHGRRWLAVLLGFHIVMCCLSLIFVAAFYPGLKIVMFDRTHLFSAALSVALFAAVSVPFIFSRFSFGYFLGFYFYTMILGYLWLVTFSRFHYDHTLATVSGWSASTISTTSAMRSSFPHG